MAPSRLTALTLGAVWVLATAAALGYSHFKDIPIDFVLAVYPALILETLLYVATGLAHVRQRLAALGSWLPAVLVVTGAVPYLLLSAGLKTFRIDHFAVVVGLALVVVYWYWLFPPKAAFDLAFLGLMAGVFLSGVFKIVYSNPIGTPALDILGRVMWIRLGILAVLLVRGGDSVDFGFLPERNHWLTGVRYYLYAIVLVVPLALGSGFVSRPIDAWTQRTAVQAVATFLGFLWVVGLAEEFFFRGLLQQWLSKLTGSSVMGLALASILFGSTHLGFRAFPNWRFAALATIAGVFYGLAYLRTGSIRASMVTHALLVTTWRVFFV